MQGSPVEELLDDEQQTRKAQIFDFLEIINKSSKKNEKRKKMVSEAKSVIKELKEQGLYNIKESVEECYRVVEENARKAAEQLIQYEDACEKGIREYEEALLAKDNDLDAIRSDIEKNMDKIVRNIERGPFNQILINYENKLEIHEARIQSKSALPIGSLEVNESEFIKLSELKLFSIEESTWDLEDSLPEHTDLVELSKVDDHLENAFSKTFNNHFDRLEQFSDLNCSVAKKRSSTAEKQCGKMRDSFTNYEHRQKISITPFKDELSLSKPTPTKSKILEDLEATLNEPSPFKDSLAFPSKSSTTQNCTSRITHTNHAPLDISWSDLNYEFYKSGGGGGLLPPMPVLIPLNSSHSFDKKFNFASNLNKRFVTAESERERHFWKTQRCQRQSLSMSIKNKPLSNEQPGCQKKLFEDEID